MATVMRTRVRHKGFCEVQIGNHEACCERVFLSTPDDVEVGGQLTPRAGFEHIVHTVDGERRATVFTIADTCSIDVSHEDK
jgi:hypothetical protein